MQRSVTLGVLLSVMIGQDRTRADEKPPPPRASGVRASARGAVRARWPDRAVSCTTSRGNGCCRRPRRTRPCWRCSAIATDGLIATCSPGRASSPGSTSPVPPASCGSTGDPELKRHLERFVRDLIACQDADGYLGPFPRASRLTGHAPNVGEKGGPTWDAWGHYHVMLGLLALGRGGGRPRGPGRRRRGSATCSATGSWARSGRGWSTPARPR